MSKSGSPGQRGLANERVAKVFLLRMQESRKPSERNTSRYVLDDVPMQDTCVHVCKTTGAGLEAIA